MGARRLRVKGRALVMGQLLPPQSLTCQVTLATLLLGFSFFSCIRMWTVSRVLLVLKPDDSTNAALLKSGFILVVKKFLEDIYHHIHAGGARVMAGGMAFFLPHLSPSFLPSPSPSLLSFLP